MDGHRTDVRYAPHPGDPSWSAGWEPVSSEGARVAWDDLAETEFLWEQFWVDVTLVIGGVDFSRQYLPVLDFALAWASAPIVLRDKPRIDLHSSVEVLTFRIGREGSTVTVRSNAHEGSAEITWIELENLVDQMIERAFTILYSHHPELRTNPYLLDVRERLANLGG